MAIIVLKTVALLHEGLRNLSLRRDNKEKLKKIFLLPKFNTLQLYIAKNYSSSI